MLVAVLVAVILFFDCFSIIIEFVANCFVENRQVLLRTVTGKCFVWCCYGFDASTGLKFKIKLS